MQTKILKLLGFTLFILLVLSSCRKDLLDSGPNWIVSYGVMQGTTLINTDNGNRLNIAEIGGRLRFPLRDGMRVIASYTVLDFVDNQYNIRLNIIDSILTKPPVFRSDFTEEQLTTEIGNDPVDVIDLWFSAGRFLNVSFNIYSDNSSVPHLLNLVVDDEASTPDLIVAEIRHNAFNSRPLLRTFGRVSYLVNGLLPEGRTEVQMEIRWRDYRGRDNIRRGIFRPAASTEFVSAGYHRHNWRLDNQCFLLAAM